MMADATVGRSEEAPATDPLAAEPPACLPTLPDDVLERIACVLAHDLCGGVSSLVMLSRCDRRLHTFAVDPGVLARCAAVHGVEDASTASLALLDVIETVAGLGSHRVHFANGRRSVATQGALGSDGGTRATIRAGSSLPRVVEYALLLRRHPSLTVTLEGHEGPHETMRFRTERGQEISAALGESHKRAEAVREALCDLECLEKLDRRGNKVWGQMPVSRFTPRIHCRGWEDSVADAAGWTGTLATCHVECFFTLDGVEVPRRGTHYALATAARERDIGWARHFGLSSPEEFWRNVISSDEPE